jgi:hypothetical protein
MAFAFPTPDHLPCPDCGASLPVHGDAAHECDAERLLDYRLIGLRAEVDAFERDLADWLETVEGRFARWLAEHGRP